MEPYANKAKSEPIKLTRLEENLTNDAALELPLREQYKIYRGGSFFFFFFFFFLNGPRWPRMLLWGICSLALCFYEVLCAACGSSMVSYPFSPLLTFIVDDDRCCWPFQTSPRFRPTAPLLSTTVLLYSQKTSYIGVATSPECLPRCLGNSSPTMFPISYLLRRPGSRCRPGSQPHDVMPTRITR